MKTVNYKGYQASVEFEDGTLFVKVLHIDDLLIAECDRASEAEHTAKALIDEYLATCEELGRNPEPAFKGSFNVRMAPEQHRSIAIAAAEDGITLNAWVCGAVAEKLDCKRLSDRFDGLISKKQALMEAMVIGQSVTKGHVVRVVAHEESYWGNPGVSAGLFFREVGTRERMHG